MMPALLTRRLRLSLGTREWTPPVWALLLALAGMALFLRLGCWQLGRAAEKAEMTTRFESRSRAEPLSLPALLARGWDIQDFPVRLRGRYDNSRLVFLESQPYRGRAGFHVYTAFFPESDGTAILVNRGWVPVASDMQKLPSVPPAGSQDVTGTVALPSPFFTVGEPDYRQRPLRVGRLEMEPLSQALGVELRPFVIRLDASAADGFVRDWSPAARLGMPPEKHHAYAFQWLSLAIAVLGVLIAVNLHKSDKPTS
jgi:cytochrome oxidase assembly protein ShyY1